MGDLATSTDGVMPDSTTVRAEPAPLRAASAEPTFRALFDAEFGYVCRALRRLGVFAADVEDVSQELFVAVHRSLPEYDTSRPIRPWLFSFAFRYAANYRRLARNQGHVSDAALSTVYGHARVDADAEARDLVLRALSAMDFDRRAVVVMHDLEGFGAPEIAAQLGIPLNTVYSRLRVGRENFQRAVEALQSNGEGS
jgi:RNA polymerase sigma-70 factor, ECF subfamily